MGRYRKYRSDKALREMVEGYFASISREKIVCEAYNTGQKDGWGHFITEWRPVTNEQGVYMREREYVIPPTVGGLCAYLRISRDTWARSGHTGGAEDDPITRSLKEAEDVLRKAAAGAPLAVPGAGEKGDHL